MSDLKSKNYTRDDDFSGRPDSSVSKELQKLLKAGTTDDYKVLSNLRSKYKDSDFVDSVFEAWKDRQSYILRKARKFKQLIFDRYRVRQLAPQQLMRKAKKYQKKLGLNDDEFNMFLNLLYVEKSPVSDLMSLPTTKMSKTLGFSPSVMAASERLNVSAKDEGIVQKIIQTYAKTRAMHSQVVIQSLTYRDCAPEALTGEFRPDKYNQYSYVHPVIAALFLPRVNLLDEHMLIANIGYIVKAKQEGMPIMTKPDFELYHDLIRDPNDNACSMDSAIADLHNRYYLQTRLWDCVLNLRQGRYYGDSLSEFMTAIDNCRSNVYDAPDLTYVKDEGAILRRLLSAFSIRPTVVSTTRLWNPAGQNPYGFADDQMSMMGIGNVTSVPMVTLRLPLTMGTQAHSVDLQESLNQPQWFVENNMIVPKSQQIIHSRDVLFFYVNRRYKSINVSRVNTPCNFNTLPMTIAGWEALNDMVVNFQEGITIMNDSYYLRSVVVVDRSTSRRNLIVGSSTVVVTKSDNSSGYGGKGYLLYDPQFAGVMLENPSRAGSADGEYDRDAPITWIPGTSGFGTEQVESFYKRASTRGTIFMYQKHTVGAGILNCGC